MNIKGKHLELCRFVRDNHRATEQQAVDAGFELTMILSMYRKGVFAWRKLDRKIWLTSETCKRANLYTHNKA